MVPTPTRLRAAVTLGTVLALALPAAAAPQERPPVDDGPLVCFTTNTLPARPAEVVLHAVALRGTAAPTVIWRSRNNANVLARLDRDHVLLASYGEPYALVVVDLTRGEHRVLAEGCPHEFVAQRGDDVLHLGDPREAALDNFLHASPWRTGGERRRLCEQRFDRVPLIDGNVAIGITPGDGGVWLVSLTTATGRAIWATPKGGDGLRVALAPGGQRLAIGCSLPNARGLLTVVDLGTAKEVRAWSDLPIQVSPFSSNLPRLEVGWHDDGEVVCSETRGDAQGLRGNFVHVRRSLATGDITDESPYGPVGLWHAAPQPQPPATSHTAEAPPTFRLDRAERAARLMRTGSAQPLIVVADEGTRRGDVWVAPDGQAALACRSGADPGCVLFTADRATSHPLPMRSCYDVVWLPAMPTPTTR